jgi:hypothetical protein
VKYKKMKRIAHEICARHLSWNCGNCPFLNGDARCRAEFLVDEKFRAAVSDICKEYKRGGENAT